MTVYVFTIWIFMFMYYYFFIEVAITLSNWCFWHKKYFSSKLWNLLRSMLLGQWPWTWVCGRGIQHLLCGRAFLPRHKERSLYNVLRALTYSQMKLCYKLIDRIWDKIDNRLRQLSVICILIIHQKNFHMMS